MAIVKWILINSKYFDYTSNGNSYDYIDIS